MENRHLQAHAAALGLARAPERTGMYTTALVVQVGEQTIYLYYSGRAHAGDNLKAFLEKRAVEQPKPLVMSDALAVRHSTHLTATGRSPDDVNV